MAVRLKQATAAEDAFDRAMAARARAENRRGPGRAVDDEELAEYIRAVRALRPRSTVSAESQIAYWVQGLAVGRPRFYAAWATASRRPRAKAS